MDTNPNLFQNTGDDAELLLAARSGDKKAFAQLMNRYKDAVHFIILKMVNNKMDAEDLTIETFGKAFINIHKCEPQLSFRTWLFSIASNNAIDHLRKKRVVTVPLKSSDESGKGNEKEYPNNDMTSTDNPEEVFIKKQNLRLLSNALLSLKPKYRILLELRYFKEYSYSEIAEELNIPLSTIKVQLFRSREKLLGLLKNTEINNERQ